MGRMTLFIDTDNDAFADDPHGEIARILRKAADKIVTGNTGGALFDFNGNRVGSFQVDGEK